MDTWHILEQRFHDIGNRDHNVVMQFHKDNADECTYSLSGPVPDGEYRLTLTGRPLDGSTPKPDFSTGHYSVSELWDTLHRAGSLLNAQQQHRGYDHDGAKRFVALLVKFFGELAHEDGNLRFFANSARACGMMAGKLATLSNPDPRDKEWKPTDAQIQKVKDAVAGMRYQTTNLEAIRIAAKMQKQRVSIILKLIGHKAE